MFSCNQTGNRPVTAFEGSAPTIIRRCGAPDFGRAAAETINFVMVRLEQAGRTILALPSSGYTLGIKSGAMEFVRTASEAYGWGAEPIRPAAPTARAITDMDEAYAWLSLIPDSRMATRRIVGARSLVHPLTDRHIYPWRKLATALRLHHTQVQRQHADGIADIVAELHRQGFFN